MSTKGKLNLEPFYYVEPNIIMDDPTKSIELMFKFDDEKNEIEEFLQKCSMPEFIETLIAIFKENYANGALLASLISENVDRQKTSGGVIYEGKFHYRKDAKNIKYKFNHNDHFESLELELINPFNSISETVEKALSGKQFDLNGGKFTLTSESGIDYLEVDTNHFKLVANMNKSKRFR